jgi:hypothetical protein
VRWQKPGADEATIGSDLAACRVAGHETIQRMYGPPQPDMSSAQLAGAPIQPSLADRQLREQEVVGRCMRERGYVLVPVER